MAGIYIHIPFCKHKCAYCNFYSLASVKYKDDFLNALLKEIELRKDYLKGEEINTIYFGGGTPSLLTVSEINTIIDAISKHYNVKLSVFSNQLSASDQLSASQTSKFPNSQSPKFPISQPPEITLEANPDDLSKNYLRDLKSTPINRLSIGIQSFHQQDLEYLERTHDSKHAEQAIQLAQDMGYDNLTIDLIYGIPGQTTEMVEANIEKFLSYNIPHLSAYSLTVENRTTLKVLIDRQKKLQPDDLISTQHSQLITQHLQTAGFVHYEISNFALPGFYSKHNSIYWLGGHYIGLGPSAHSYNGQSRQWNVSNLKEYFKLSEVKPAYYEKEVLTKNQQYNEYVMTSLRTSWGVDLEHIENIYGISAKRHSVKVIETIDKSMLIVDGNVFKLSEKGKHFADGLAAEFFLED